MPKKEFYANYREMNSDDFPVVCRKCGAMVLDTEEHSKFHKVINALATAYVEENGD
jgi:hypothetical protein